MLIQGMKTESEKESEFDTLVKLHTEVKSFKIEKSAEILKNFHSKEHAKFKLTAEEKEEPPRLNLSSTTVCAYALSQYCELWDEAGMSDKYESEFRDIEEYYDFIINGLDGYLKSKSNNNISKLEAPDEFSLLNMLLLLKKIHGDIKKENKDFKRDNKVVFRIIKLLCEQFEKNRFSYGEKPHPFIYYKFLRIIDDWENGMVKWNEEEHNEAVELKSRVDKVKKKNNNENNKASFDCFFKEFYEDAKYEMYRQIALYNAADLSLFDVKRLIYSLLIVKMNDKYSNNLIKDKVLKLIFEEQLKTGLFPIGHVVNTDFVIEENEIVDKTKRIISASPMLSSVECLNDMLTHKEIETDLEKYQKKLNLTYEWIIKRLRKESPDKPLGWFPEYESTHTAESWVAGHTLIFLKKYCEMLSELIEKNARKDLQAKEPKELTIKWDKLYDSYKVKKCIKYMVQEDTGLSNPDYRSALIFGPPGSGKSTIAKALAKRLEWNYVELSPILFLTKGEQNIIPRANEIFKRLVRMKKTVIFFDEVDQLVKSREKAGEKGSESSIWIVTALLPKFQELWAQKEIKFILATNNIEEVDTAMMRPGRIDAVLPMGAICWKDRLKVLRDAIDDGNNQIKDNLRQKKGIFNDLLDGDILKNDRQIDEMEKEDIKNRYLQNFLGRTDFMPLLEIKSIVERLFNKGSWKEVGRAHSYKELFSGDGSSLHKHIKGSLLGDYENSEFRKFHWNLLDEYKDKKYVHMPTEIPREKYIEEIENNIFWKFEVGKKVITADRKDKKKIKRRKTRA